MLLFTRSLQKLLGDVAVEPLAHLEIVFGNFVSRELGRSVQEVVQVAPVVLLMGWLVPDASDTLAANLRDGSLAGEVLQDVQPLLLGDFAGSHQSERVVCLAQILKGFERILNSADNVVHAELVGMLAGNTMLFVERSHPVGANQPQRTANGADAVHEVERVVYVQTEAQSVTHFGDFNLGILELETSLETRSSAHNEMLFAGRLKTEIGQDVFDGFHYLAVLNHVVILGYSHFQDCAVVHAARHKRASGLALWSEDGNFFHFVVVVGGDCVF